MGIFPILTTLSTIGLGRKLWILDNLLSSDVLTRGSQGKGTSNDENVESQLSCLPTYLPTQGSYKCEKHEYIEELGSSSGKSMLIKYDINLAFAKVTCFEVLISVCFRF